MVRLPATALIALIFGLLMTTAVPLSAQATPERFWLAGCYDGNHIIVYFQAVKFKGTVPAVRRRINPPVSDGFFIPEELPADYVAAFQKSTGAEHFSLGDTYDLLTGDGGVVPITLTTLVGTEGDEEVGNDSYIGALATLSNRSGVPPHGYYAVRRHREVKAGPKMISALFARLLDEPTRLNTQTRIAALLTQRQRMNPTGVSPRFSIQQFRLANGSLRYYAQADWSSAKGQPDEKEDILAAWISPIPGPHILATESRMSPDGLNATLPRLLNVVDLGDGRTGLVVASSGEDSIALTLFEYRDGLSRADASPTGHRSRRITPPDSDYSP